MSYQCPKCKKKEPLYKCPTCGAMGHIDIENKEITIHAPQPFKPDDLKPSPRPVSACFPSHFDCELGKPITEINIQKLVKVETK